MPGTARPTVPRPWSFLGAHEQVETATEARVDASEQNPAQAIGKSTRDPSQPIERGRPTGLLDLPLDRAPEQIEDLRDDDHRGHAMLANRLEDHARVAAA